MTFFFLRLRQRGHPRKRVAALVCCTDVVWGARKRHASCPACGHHARAGPRHESPVLLGSARHLRRTGPHMTHKSETRDGMTIAWDAPIPMDDGVVLRADVFRPPGDGKYPVILSYGPYAKGLSMQEAYRHAWVRIVKAYPGIEQGSSNKYQNWELLDPERWVADGYVLVRVDSRGAGRSPGHLDPWSAREAKDLAACIDWAGTEPWSN